MAYAVEVTISTGNKVSINYQSQEVGISLTYRLEREDSDVLAIVAEKAAEVVDAHARAWQEVQGARKQSENLKKSGARSASSANGDSAEDENTAEIQAEIQVESHQNSGEVATTLVAVSTPTQQSALRGLLLRCGWSEESIGQQLTIRYGCRRLEQLSERQAASWLLELQRSERQRVQQMVNSAKAIEPLVADSPFGKSV